MRTDRWNKKRELNLYAFYDHTGLERHLEKMAANGWMLESVGTYALRYRRCEPKKLRFAVVYYPKTDSFCPDEPNHENLTFWDYCAGAGWQIVTQRDETVVLLSHKKADSYIHIDVEFGEGEGKIPVDSIAKRAEAYKPKEKVTYKMIKEYIEAKYGFKVHTAYIAEVKRDLGLPMYDAPNAVEELKQPRKHPTPEKVEAIKDALRYFAVI